MKPWYQSWFNSPYYHLLYQSRDSGEAEFFLDKLLLELELKPGSRIVDIACGKGRHSVYLNKKGFDVTGIDLSKESIKHCRQFEEEKLEFYEHDMRELFRVNYFDAAFNLFTSFGYFDREHDNLLALKSAASALKFNGILVLDYFNSNLVRKGLPAQFNKECNRVQFSFKKEIKEGRVEKLITINDGGKEFIFSESVWLYNLVDFQKLFSQCGLTIKNTFGDYHLNAFNEAHSERLILVAEKSKNRI